MENKSHIVCKGMNLVLGYGKFGRRAVRMLQSSQSEGESILVIDKEPQIDVPQGVQFVGADAVEWFSEKILYTSDIYRVIPALPIHFAARWLTRKLTMEGWDVASCPLPDSLLAEVPHPMRLNQHSAVASHADFLCPDNCPEPDEICTHTGRKRPPPLYQILDALDEGQFTPLIVKSRQFSSGIGGFFYNDLLTLLGKAKQLTDHQILVGTACKCHGILDGMYVKLL